MSADVATVRAALNDAVAIDNEWWSGEHSDALAALDRLAAAEAQRDTLAEALAKVDRCAGEHDGITPEAFEALTDITGAALAAVAPTEAKP